jgi:hypothetical protein
MKIVVFDLDETLGYFTQFGIFWDSLNNYLKDTHQRKLSQFDFNDILDLYPEFLRPNILNILYYLKHKKKTKCCHKMMIYTNNNGPREWAHYIVKYFEAKINYPIIDQIIAAFKVNGEIVEIYRTTHSKTYDDFIRCTQVPKNAEICFLDDAYHPKMVHDNIFYINIKPYYHDLNFQYMIQRLKNSSIGKQMMLKDSQFDATLLKKLKGYNYTVLNKYPDEYSLDKKLGAQILAHLEEFFQQSMKTNTNTNTNTLSKKYLRTKTERKRTNRHHFNKTRKSMK